MASIPLPALHIAVPQQQDPTEQFTRLLQLKNAIANAPLQRQAMQQQVEAGQQENQMRAQSIKDQQAMTSAMQSWDGKDAKDLVPLMIKNGASANAVMGLKAKVLEQQKTLSDMAAADATTGSKNIETLKSKNDMLAGRLSTVQGLPDDQIGQGVAQAAQELAQQGLLDPQHAQVAAQLANQPPAQIRTQLAIMEKGLTSQSQQIAQAAQQAKAAKDQASADETRGKINPQSPFYAPSQASIDLGTAPGAAQIQQGEAKRAATKAAAEAAVKQPFEMALARQKQALSQGDPKAAAQLLLDGDATLSELKARGSTPQFIAQTLYNAHQMSGGKYNAQEAESNFNIAKSQANTAFFGSAKSLVDPGGTLDQLAEVGKRIPQSQLPVLNSIADWEKAATGSGPIAEYAAKALGVADDYAKVMGGGQGSDTSRLQALKVIAANQSPEQRAGALNGIRGSVNSQITSRIGKNPIMQRMYGSESQQPQAGQPLKITLPSGKQISIE